MYRTLRLCGVWAALTLWSVAAQAQDTTAPTSVDPALLEIFNQKIPKRYTIAEIKVTGAQFFDPGLVISISGLNVGDQVVIPGGDNFAKAITKLWQQSLFTNIQVFITKLEGSNIWVEINAQERPRMSRAIFRGIRKSEAEELKEKVGILQGQVVTESRKMTAIANIEKYYFDKGFKGASVQVFERPDTNSVNSVDLVLDVVKGDKVRVDNVNFFGNEQVDDLKLKGKMKGTKEMSRLRLKATPIESPYGEVKTQTLEEFLRERGYFNPSKIKDYLDPWFRFKLFSSAKFSDKKYQEDKESILQFYNSRGYRDMQIIADTQYYNRTGNLNVDLKLEEGRRYYFGNIVWRGNTRYSDSLLNIILGIKKGDIYNIETLNRGLGKELSPEGGDISGLYMDDGYLFFRTEIIETRVYNDTIDHEIRVIEGPQATIKNINISGNDKTKDYVIRREIRTLPGDKFSRSALIRSQREIANLGYFDQEKIDIQPVPNMADGTVDINYGLVERSSDQLELSAGFGGGIGLTGTLGVVFNNFSVRNIFNKKSWDPLPSGDGQKLSLRFQSNGRFFRSLNFSFTEPWLGGKKRNSLTLSAYTTKYANAYDPLTGQFTQKRADSSYLKTLGFGISYGKQLRWPDDFFNLVLSLNYVQYDVRNYNIFPGLSSGLSRNISLKVALNRTSIDQPIFPRSGSNFLASAQFTPPYSYIGGINKTNPYELVEFHKYRFTGEWYVPIGKPMGAEKNRQFVLKLAAKYGFIGRYNPKLEVSPFERFQVGDAGLTNNFGILGFDIIAHRGYPVYQVSDPTVNPDQQNATEFFTIFNKYTAELRYPFVTNPSSTIYGLTFFEAANGWYSFKEWNPFRLRRSVGVGMRFFLPMFGLLGFDYGVGLDRLSVPGARLRDATRFTFMLGFEPE